MIYDEVALGLRARGMKESDIKIRVENVLKICGLYAFRNWPIAALSYGQKEGHYSICFSLKSGNNHIG